MHQRGCQDPQGIKLQLIIRALGQRPNNFQPSSPEIATLRDIFTYRSYIAQNKFLVVLDEIHGASAPEIQPLKMLAEYLHSKSNRDAVLEQMAIKVDTVAGNETLVLVAATMYIQEGNLDAAYRYLHSSESLEALAFMVHILLALDRVDLALKKLKEMQEKDDDATLTQLAQAWIHTALVGSEIERIVGFSCSKCFRVATSCRTPTISTRSW